MFGARRTKEGQLSVTVEFGHRVGKCLRAVPYACSFQEELSSKVPTILRDSGTDQQLLKTEKYNTENLIWWVSHSFWNRSIFLIGLTPIHKGFTLSGIIFGRQRTKSGHSPDSSALINKIPKWYLRDWWYMFAHWYCFTSHSEGGKKGFFLSFFSWTGSKV